MKLKRQPRREERSHKFLKALFQEISLPKLRDRNDASLIIQPKLELDQVGNQIISPPTLIRTSAPLFQRGFMN